ncbi:hypothetical protein ACQR1I_14915 [Bradyrhizobium sp. HKCCYLS2038]|uniref:hypothetical protein n=1 Tax=unclassified Bradyrhizobium TaxID=2631580 RepID=UPI003EB9EFF3
MQKTEPDAFLKARGKWVVDHFGSEVVVWVPLGLLIFAVSVSLGTYPLVAFLAVGGLFAVLMLRRLFKLDKPIDDRARAATRPQIMQDAEKWADSAFAYVCWEIIVWVAVGAIWGLFVLLRT